MTSPDHFYMDFQLQSDRMQQHHSFCDFYLKSSLLIGQSNINDLLKCHSQITKIVPGLNSVIKMAAIRALRMCLQTRYENIFSRIKTVCPKYLLLISEAGTVMQYQSSRKCWAQLQILQPQHKCY